MSRIYTYSFDDTSVTFNHVNFGTYSIIGTGTGSVRIEYSNDVTTHDVAADLAVVVSKSVKKNGVITLSILQTSGANEWLTKFANYLETSDTSQFALGTAVIKNTSTGEMWTCKGVTHQKKSGGSFSSTAEQKQWSFMCAVIEQS